jgi:hypothetical protein
LNRGTRDLGKKKGIAIAGDPPDRLRGRITSL